MADDIQLKRSNVPGLAPAAAELLDGELAFNSYDGKLYAKSASGVVSVINPSASLVQVVSGSDNVTVETTSGVATVSVEAPPVAWADIIGRPTKVSELENDSGFVNALGAADASPVQSIIGANAAVVSEVGRLFTVDVPLQKQANWGEADVSSVSFIQNKPTALSQFENDKSYVDATGAALAAPVQSISAADGTIVVGGTAGAVTLRAAIEIPAQKQADWGESNTLSASFIQNKPTKLSEFTNDSGFVNSAEAADAAPVQGIASGANVTVTSVDGVYTISASQNPGTIDKVSGIAPIAVANGTTAPEISVAAATSSSAGVVRLASQADLMAGVSGAVVDAAQLVASSPTKLSQLTNDQGFVTQASIDAKVAGYLPLTGGVITGTLAVAPGGSATVPTPVARDASQKVATTEWVQRELAALQDQTSSWVFGGTYTSGNPGIGFFRLSADGLFLAISKYDSDEVLAAALGLDDGDEVVLAPPAGSLAPDTSLNILLENSDRLLTEASTPIIAEQPPNG